MSRLEEVLEFHLTSTQAPAFEREYRCTKCGKKKPLDDFYIRADNNTRRNQCKACVCERERTRRIENPTRSKEIQRKTYLKNKKAYFRRAKRWAEKNPEKRREVALSYALKNIDKIKKWTKDNPEKLRDGRRRRQAKRRAAQCDAGGNVSKDEWVSVGQINDGMCVYCGNEAIAIDHFIPISKGGRNEVGNLVPACTSCNSKKGASDPNEWVMGNFSKERLDCIKEILNEST